MERIEQDETIDLQKLFAIIVDRKKLFGGIVAGFTAVALIISLLLPKEYTSQVTVQAASGDMGIVGAAAAMAAITGKTVLVAFLKNSRRRRSSSLLPFPINYLFEYSQVARQLFLQVPRQVYKHVVRQLPLQSPRQVV